MGKMPLLEKADRKIAAHLTGLVLTETDLIGQLACFP
jgi:hypothetical protein